MREQDVNLVYTPAIEDRPNESSFDLIFVFFTNCGSAIAF